MDYDYDQLSVDFIIDGAVMTAGNAPKELRATLAAIEDDVRRKLAGIKDENGRPPKVLMQGKDTRNLQFTIRGSKAVIEEAQKRMGRG